jgi:hypothetical protein
MRELLSCEIYASVRTDYFKTKNRFFYIFAWDYREQKKPSDLLTPGPIHHAKHILYVRPGTVRCVPKP